MGFSHGKSSSMGMSGQSATQRLASNLLLEAIIPGSSMTGGYVSQKGQAPVLRTPQQLAQEQAQQQQQAAAARDPRWPTTVPDHVTVGPALQPGQSPQQYFIDSVRPGGNTPPQIPPGYTVTNEGQVVPLPGMDKHGQPLQESLTPTLFGTGDPIEQTVSRQMGNFVPSARQQGFGALAGHGMTEGFRGQAGPYQDIWGEGRVASYEPLTQTETDAVTNTLLPSMDDMRWKTIREQIAAGKGDPADLEVLDFQQRAAKDPIGFAMEASNTINNKILEGKALELPTLPEIDEYVTKVYQNMPEPLKNVVDDVMTQGTNANLENTISNAADKLWAQTQKTATNLTDDVFARFSASGVSGGAALAAAGQVISDVSADFSAKMLDFTTQALQQANQDRQLALEAVSTIVGVAGQQQQMDRQGDIINLETTVNVLQAQANIYTTLQQEFLKQSQFYTSMIFQAYDRLSTEDVNNYRLIYEIMLSLATGGPALSTQRSKSTQFGFQSNISKQFGGGTTINIPPLGGDDG